MSARYSETESVCILKGKIRRLEPLNEEPERDAENKVRRENLRPDRPFFPSSKEPEPDQGKDHKHDNRPRKNGVNEKRENRVGRVRDKEPALLHKDDVDEAEERGEDEMNREGDKEQLAVRQASKRPPSFDVNENGEMMFMAVSSPLKDDGRDHKKKSDETGKSGAKKKIGEKHISLDKSQWLCVRRREYLRDDPR